MAAEFQMDMDFYEEIDGKFYAPHDVDEVTDFPFRWVDWLADSDSDSIASVTAIYQSPLSLPAGKTNQHDGQNAKIWVTGGTTGLTLRLTCRITTVGGRTQDRSVFLRCRER